MKDVLGIFVVVILIGLVISKLRNKYIDWSIEKAMLNKLTSSKNQKQLDEPNETSMVRRQRLNKQYYERLYGDSDFVNSKTSDLASFIINSELTPLDIHKLAELNGFKITGMDGWLSLLVDMVQELERLGWKRKLHFVKQKWGELQFGLQDDSWELSPEERKQLNQICSFYTNLSRKKCQKCGNPGTLENFETRCSEHKQI